MKVMKTKEWDFLGTIKNKIFGEGYLFQHKTHLDYVIVKSAKLITSVGVVLILSMRAGDQQLMLSEHSQQTHPELSNSYEDISSILSDEEESLLNVFTA